MPPARRGSAGESFALPYATAFARRAHHRVAVFAAKRAGKYLHVRQRPVHTQSRQRVRVGRRQQAHELRAHAAAPYLRKSQKKSLLRREAINTWRARLALLKRRARISL